MMWFTSERSVHSSEMKQNLHPSSSKEIERSGFCIFHLTSAHNLLAAVSVCDETHICRQSLRFICSSQKTQPLWYTFPILNLKSQLKINRHTRKQVLCGNVMGTKGHQGQNDISTEALLARITWTKVILIILNKQVKLLCLYVLNTNLYKHTFLMEASHFHVKETQTDLLVLESVEKNL